MSKNERLRGILTQLPSALGVAAGVVAVLLTAYYMLFPARGYYHSDCADTIFWAQASVDAGALYNPDFDYACLLPFGGSLLMMPFVALWDVSYAAHTAGMLLFVAALAAALVWLCRKAEFGWGWTGVTVASVFGVLCNSEKLREIYFGHTIYYSLGSLFLLVGLALLLRAERAQSQSRLAGTVWLALTGVWFALCALNGLPSLALFTAPVLVGFYGERLFDHNAKLLGTEQRPALLVTLMAACGTVAGYVVGTILGADIVAGYESAFSRFTPTGEWVEHIENFIPHWLTLLGCGMSGGEHFLESEGLAGLLRIAVGLLLLVVPFVGLFFWKKLARATRVVLLSHAAVSAILLFAFVFGSLSSANWRLSPMVFTSVLSTVMLARELCCGVTLRTGVVLQAAVTAMALFGLLTVAEMPADYHQNEGLPAVAAYLEQQDLTYGYATFWNAGTVTVLSDSEVKVRNINIEGDRIVPYRYQSQKEWFTDQGDGENYFLLLTPYEHSQLLSAESPLLETATRTEEFAGYIIVHLPDCPF